MSTDETPAPQGEQRHRVPTPIWVALGVAVFIAIVCIMIITHSAGVPMLTPGH